MKKVYFKIFVFCFTVGHLSCGNDSSCITCIENATSLNAEYEICDDGNGGVNVKTTLFGQSSNINVTDITAEQYANDLEVTGVATCDN